MVKKIMRDLFIISDTEIGGCNRSGQAGSDRLIRYIKSKFKPLCWNVCKHDWG